MKAFGALEITHGPRHLCLRLRELTFQAIYLRLKWAGVNLEQQVALMNDCAFLEMHALQIPGNSRANFDRVDGLQPPGKLVTVAQLLADDVCHTNFDRSRGRSRLWLS
jgi:hypothetical protein